MKPKYRIVYTVLGDLSAKTLRAALADLDAQSDDLDEFCSGAIDNRVTAKLQKCVKGVWLDIPSEGRHI